MCYWCISYIQKKILQPRTGKWTAFRERARIWLVSEKLFPPIIKSLAYIEICLALYWMSLSWISSSVCFLWLPLCYKMYQGFFFFLHIAIVYSHCHMTHAIWTHHDLLCIVPVWANLNSAAVSFRVHICTQMYIHISGGYRSTNEILESEGMPVFICGRPCPTAFQNGCCSLFFAINWEDQLFLILDNSWYHRSHFLPF